MSSITLFVNVNNKHAYKQKHAATHSPHFAKNDESDTSITDDENDDEISEESETDTCHCSESSDNESENPEEELEQLCSITNKLIV